MATTLVTVLITFLLTGVAGNRLIHAWQHRNWIEQQRLRDTEREYAALEEVFDEVASLLGKRHYRMLRLALTLPRGDAETIRQRRAELAEAVVDWNEKLNLLYAKLTMRLTWNHALRLQAVQQRFVALDQRLERLVHTKLGGDAVAAAEVSGAVASLNALGAEIRRFNQAVLKFIKQHRAAIYKTPELDEGALHRLPTWELFKALFQPRVKGKNVI